MKRTTTLIALLAALTLPAHAQDTTRIDTLHFYHPEHVAIAYSDTSLAVSIDGLSGNPDCSFSKTLAVKPNPSTTIINSEHDDSYDFKLSFLRHRSHPNSHTEFTHFALRFGLNNTPGQPAPMHVDMGRSWEISWEMFDWYRHFNSNVSISAGMWLTWKSLRQTGHTRFLRTDEGNITLADYPEGANVKFSRLKTFGLSFPILLHLNAAKWRLSLGPEINWWTHGSILTRYKTPDENGKMQKVKEASKDIPHNAFTVDIMGMISYDDIGFYVKYDPCNMLSTERGPKLHRFTVGVNLGF